MDATYETAVKELRSGNIYPIYVLYGKENFLKKRMLDDIVKRAVSEDTAEYNYSVFDGEKSVDDFCDAAESAPFFAERRVVTLKDTELSKLPADKSARVADIIELCDDALTVIFYYSGDTYKPDKKLGKSIDQKGLIISFDDQSPAKLATWLRRQAEASQKQIDDNAVDYIINNCGPSMEHMHNEMAKILSYSRREKITLADVKQTAVVTVEAAVFDMTDALAFGRYERALNILSELFAQKEQAPAILGALSSSIANLYRIKTAISCGVPAQQLQSECKIAPFIVRKLTPVAERTDIKLLRRWIHSCADADTRLKSASGMTDKMILETLIFEMLKKG